MKIIIAGLSIIILGIITMIFMDDNTKISSTNNLVQEKTIEKNTITDEQMFKEMCDRMPEMEGCEKYNQNSDEKKMSTGKIEILNNNIQLGELPMDEGKVEIVFEIINTGNQNVLFSEANGSCFCTQGFITDMDGTNKSVELNTIGSKYPTLLERVIKPGEKLKVTAIYDPAAHGPDVVGYTTRGLTIKTNSSITPLLKFNFSGTVVKTRSK